MARLRLLSSGLLAALLLPLLFSCAKGPYGRLSPETGTDAKGRVLLPKTSAEGPVLIESKANLDAIVRYDSAAILVRKDGCRYCQETMTELVPYLKKRKALFYAVDAAVYQEAYRSPDNTDGQYKGLYPKILGTPTFLFYGGGKLENIHEGAFDPGKLEESLDSYLAVLPTVQINDVIKVADGDDLDSIPYEIEVDEETDDPGRGTMALEKKIQAKEDFTVLFTWRRCSDCASYRKEVLYPFFSEGFPEKDLYVYETDGYFLYRNRLVDGTKNPDGVKAWSSFAEKFHLADYGGKDEEGNALGYVPTLVHFKADGSVDLDVFQNDVGLKKNEDGTYSFEKAFLPEVQALKSRENDKTDALKDLRKQALPLEKKASLSFLKEALA